MSHQPHVTEVPLRLVTEPERPYGRHGTAKRVGPAASRGTTRPTAATFRRRRLVVLLGALTLVFLATIAFDRVGAEAGLEDPVAGHAVVEPGETLWDLAVATADGVDPRQQLADLRDLNGFERSEVDAWTVVLLPAR